MHTACLEEPFFLTSTWSPPPSTLVEMVSLLSMRFSHQGFPQLFRHPFPPSKFPSMRPCASPEGRNLFFFPPPMPSSGALRVSCVNALDIFPWHPVIGLPRSSKGPFFRAPSLCIGLFSRDFKHPNRVAPIFSSLFFPWPFAAPATLLFAVFRFSENPSHLTRKFHECIFQRSLGGDYDLGPFSFLLQRTAAPSELKGACPLTPLHSSPKLGSMRAGCISA